MKSLFLNFKIVPRWVIWLVDLLITGISFTLSYFLIKQFEFPEILRGHYFVYTGLYCFISGIIFYLLHIHTGLIRYSNVNDMLRIFCAILIVSIIYPIIDLLVVVSQFHIRSLNVMAIVLLNFFVASSLHIMLRVFIKEFYYYVKQSSFTGKERVLIYGADNEAILIKQAIESGSANRFLIAGFIDADTKKVNKYIQQKKVFPIKALPELKSKKNVDKLVVMHSRLVSDDKNRVIDKCLQHGITVLTVPPSDQWISGKLSLKQIQELKIEDLLQREPIVIDDFKISEEVKGKRILITGAAGSIGSEIVRQVLRYHPEMIILCDQAESFLHDIQLEMEELYTDVIIKVFIGSIRDYNRMQIPFAEYAPHIVFHAAAYKHVPMMEYHPSEAILTNVLGTKNIADLSVLHKVSKFVMVSTDKAVNPTNVMGASKRIAEMYVQSLSNALQNPFDERIYHSLNGKTGYVSASISTTKTKFVTTRFGNVLGSNGSVIPRFRLQILKGGPITVTDPEITRYFMTIPEAVQLVLEACAMGKGGEIFVFDMGKPVKIVDLATKMIQLAGLIPGEDIKIVFTGLRPGEKLYEELLNKEEFTLPTHHEKIKVARVVPFSKTIQSDIEELITMSMHKDCSDLVKKMKELVPEFKSKNSKFEKLDATVTTTLLEIISGH